MPGHWTEIVANNYEEVAAARSKAARELDALYWLISEWENGGLSQYFSNMSSDSLPDVQKAFSRARCGAGLAWLKKVDALFGGSVPRERDLRIDSMDAFGAFEGPCDPFESLDAELQRIVPQIDAFATKLVDRIPAIDKNKKRVWPETQSGTDWSSKIPDHLKG